MKIHHAIVNPPGINAARPFAEIGAGGRHTPQIQTEGVLHAGGEGGADGAAFVEGGDGALVFVCVVVPVLFGGGDAREDVLVVDVAVVDDGAGVLWGGVSFSVFRCASEVNSP